MVAVAAGPTAGTAQTRLVVDRERLCNDALNTGVAATLIGGFALGNMDISYGVAIYILSSIAVHACTCSCLTSAFIYRTMNVMHDDDALAWAARHSWLLKMPFLKFVMGCGCYLATVIVLSWEALAPHAAARYATLAIGVLSMSSVGVTHLILARDSPAKEKD